MPGSQSQSTKPRRKKVVLFAGLVILATAFALAFGLPYLSTDGTEKFTGKELKLAKEAIGDGSYNGTNTSPTLDLPVPFRAKVTDVYKQEPEKRCSVGERQGSVYIVEIDRVTFFGILAPGYDLSSCEFDE